MIWMTKICPSTEAHWNGLRENLPDIISIVLKLTWRKWLKCKPQILRKNVKMYVWKPENNI